MFSAQQACDLRGQSLLLADRLQRPHKAMAAKCCAAAAFPGSTRTGAILIGPAAGIDLRSDATRFSALSGRLFHRIAFAHHTREPLVYIEQAFPNVRRYSWAKWAESKKPASCAAAVMVAPLAIFRQALRSRCQAR